MNSPNRTNLPNSQALLDESLDELGLFPKRVTNALLRCGIVTPRLLIMHTPELIRSIWNLGPASLAYIEFALGQQGLALAEDADEDYILLARQLVVIFRKVTHPLSLSALAQMVDGYWDETEVAMVVANHPYIVEIESGYYQFRLNASDSFALAPLSDSLPATASESVMEQGKLLLSKVGFLWLESVNENQQETLFLFYGVQGGEVLTLQETGELLSITRERVRQIKNMGLQRLRTLVKWSYWQPMHQLLSEGIQQAGSLLTLREWEQWLDKSAIWEANEPRPSLLHLLCDIFSEFHYLDHYHVATFVEITSYHLSELSRILKLVLHPHKGIGLAENELVVETQQRLPDDFPSAVRESAFILKAISLFDRIGMGVNGRYFYLRKKIKSPYPTIDSGWAGKPGTQLYEWEQWLRQQFEKVAWIGQIPLTESDFADICQAIQEESLAPDYFTKIMGVQPQLVPPATFLTSTVFAARYSEETAAEFWNPYLRNVWNLEYTQAFMTRCRKRFISIVPYLEQTFGFEFPSQSAGDLVRPVYRHALLPRYVQTDFAAWLRSRWRDILAIADSTDLFIRNLQHDRSLSYLPQQLQNFVLDEVTRETAASLITNMAAAISLYVNDGESIEEISELLADTPIEQELWHEIAQEFRQEKKNISTPLRYSPPRVTWVWSVDEEELVLRVQNIVVLPDNKQLGEPDRLVWLEAADDDPSKAEIEIDVTPWRMKTGERIIQDVFLSEPDGPINGFLVLLTDRDEEAARLTVPAHPGSDVQFFRATQHGAYGIPVDSTQVGDGVWFVCAQQVLTFIDEDGELIEPDGELRVPYPLTDRYNWAAQLTLALPVAVRQGAKEIFVLTQESSQPLVGLPSLVGTALLEGLSRQVQPTFGSTQLALNIEYGGERLVKQASVWIQGQDGWRWQQTLSELRRQGHAALIQDSLRVDLSHFLPSRPNLYTIQLRISLQPVFALPLQFAIVPGLDVTALLGDRLYTPANLPQLLLRGVRESSVVRREGFRMEMTADGSQQITWTDLRYEPRLLLRFDKVEIPLAWSVPRFMVWLEPKPTKPFLTLDELRQTTLHAVGTRVDIDTFTLFVPDQQGRRFVLRRGRYSTRIGESQLYDMVDLPRSQHTQINARVGNDSWPLFEVHRRPELPLARVEYDPQEQIVVFNTGLKEEWAGNGRFVVESLTNPFASIVELARVTRLQNVHLLPG